MITKEYMEKLVYDSQKHLGSDELENVVTTQEDASLRSPGVPAHYYRYLYFLVKDLKPRLIVELGTHTGISSACMAEGCPQSQIITIDHKSQVKPECKRNNIEYWVQDSLAPVKKSLININILFIDTLHNGVRTLKEYEYWLPHMAEESIILFDDVYLCEEMRQFWNNFNPGHIKIDLNIHGKVGFGAVLLKKGL